MILRHAWYCYFDSSYPLDRILDYILERPQQNILIGAKTELLYTKADSIISCDDTLRLDHYLGNKCAFCSLQYNPFRSSLVILIFNVQFLHYDIDFLFTK